MELFLQILKREGISLPEKEYKFSKTRKWRFDYAWPDYQIAIEQEGAVWTNGRHTRGSGFIKDMEKYNAAAMDGWTVLRYTPEQLLTTAVEDIKLLLMRCG